MSFEVTPSADTGEFMEAFWAIGQYFGAPLTEERSARFLRNLDVERMHAAREDGRIVGGAGAFTFDFSVPGGSLPCGGVTVVGVYPTHRRRGVLRAMMRAQLDDIHERGEPLAALWASEATIYARFGYGIASLQGEIEVVRERNAYAAALVPRGRIRLVESEEAAQAFPPIWEAFRARRPGAFARREPWWELRTIGDPEDFRAGAGPKRFALLELDGKPAAYAIYRHQLSFDGGVSTGVLKVVEAIAAEPQAEAEIWRFLLDIDWSASLTAALLPPDHPLFLLVAEPRRLRYRAGDGLWLRLVDLETALPGRRYLDDGPLVLEVADAFCPWNEGRWRLEAGEVARTDDEPDLRLDVRDLGSLFLGGFTATQLRGAVRLEELKPGAVERADAVFRWPVHPWCPEIF